MYTYAMSDSPTGVTIVIPTLDRAEFLLQSVQDLLAQDYRTIEILIIDQSSDTPPSVKELVERETSTIAYHRVDFRGLPLARNFAAKVARYPC